MRSTVAWRPGQVWFFCFFVSIFLELRFECSTLSFVSACPPPKKSRRLFSLMPCPPSISSTLGRFCCSFA